MPNPAAPAYLTTPDAAKSGQKGGTLIAEDIHDIREHRRFLESGNYRPSCCPLCGRFLHILDQRPRRFRDQPCSAEELICRYRCRPCGAVWQVLPGFIARHLHRTWGAVQSALAAADVLARTGCERHVRRKASTLRRWLIRLGASALALTQALLAAEAPVKEVLETLGAWCSRGELVEGLAQAGSVEKKRKLQDLACWIHRLSPGLRLM